MSANPVPAQPGAVFGLAAVGLAVCCGLPALLSFAAGVTVAGVGLRSWLLAAAGLVGVGAGTAWIVSHRRGDTAAGRDC